MPDASAAPGSGFLGSLLVDGTCFGSTFAGGIVGNLVASAGYDLLKIPSRNLARWAREQYLAGDPAPNHDLLRAARHAESLAGVVVCELALFDHGVVPDLWEAVQIRDSQSLVRRVTDRDVRILLRARSDLLSHCQRLQARADAVSEADGALLVRDLEALARAGAELPRLGAAPDSDALLSALREHATDSFRFRLAQELRLPRPLGPLAWCWWWVAGAFRGHDARPPMPPKLQARIGSDWFPVLLRTFRDNLKSERFPAARHAFLIDRILALGTPVPPDLSGLLARLDQADARTDRLVDELTALRDGLRALGRAGRLDHTVTRRALDGHAANVRSLLGDMSEQIRQMDQSADIRNADTASKLDGIGEGVEVLAREVAAIRDQMASPRAELLPEVFPPAPLCVERDAIVASLAERLVSPAPRPVAVLGLAGVGKSTVALAAAHSDAARSRFGEHRYFVRAEQCPDADALLRITAQTVGLDPGHVSVAALSRHLGGKPALLLIDNFETPWQADAGAAEHFCTGVAAADGVELLVTMRGDERPGGPGWLAPADTFDLPPLEPAAARALFLQLAPGHGDDPALAGLLAAMDGLPLAITLLANLALAEPDLTVVAKRWQSERTRLLRRAAGNTRATSLEVALELSVERLDPAAREFCESLARLPAGLAAADLETLWPEDGYRSLAAARKTGLAFVQDRRARMLQPVREYIVGTSESAGSRERLAKHYVAIAAAGQQVGEPGGAEIKARLALDWPNCEAMIAEALRGTDWKTAAFSCGGYAEFVRFSGMGTVVPFLAAEARARREGEQSIAANCIRSLGDLALARSDHEGARERYEEALTLYTRIREPYSMGRARESLVAVSRSDAERSEHCRAARAAWAPLGLPHLLRHLDAICGETPGEDRSP